MSVPSHQNSSLPNRQRLEFIFNFHGLGRPSRAMEPGEEMYWLPEEQFERVLDHLSKLRRTCCRIGITFDDGNASDLQLALPRLLARNLKATFFALAGRLDNPNFLSRSDLRALEAAGMVVGTHGFDHIDWRYASEADLTRELCTARDQLADTLGRPIDEIAIPYGAYNARVLKCLRQQNYRAVFTSDGGSASYSGWLRPRTCIRRDTSLADIDEIVGRSAFVSGLLPHARRIKHYLFPPQRYSLN
jgi:peptidoglycan/xylan/chitin deacetylase (PgdA/CDA1 family)